MGSDTPNVDGIRSFSGDKGLMAAKVYNTLEIITKFMPREMLLILPDTLRILSTVSYR